MINTDKPLFGSMLRDVYAHYGQTLTSGMLEMWWQGLYDLNVSDVRRALNSHVQNPDTGEFAPKIANIRRALGGSTLTQGMQAWSKVDQAVRQVGTYESVVFDDPIIHSVIHDMGGWIELGKCKEDEWPFKAREFEKRYIGLKLNPRTEYPRRLIGIAEAENAQHGFALSPPMMIGNPAKCEQVYLKGANQVHIGFKTMSEEVAKSATLLIDHKQKETA